MSLYVEVGVDAAVLSDTTDGCAKVTCDVSEVVGYADIWTSVHSAKHVLSHHGFPCDVAGSVGVSGKGLKYIP